MEVNCESSGDDRPCPGPLGVCGLQFTHQVASSMASAAVWIMQPPWRRRARCPQRRKHGWRTLLAVMKHVTAYLIDAPSKTKYSKALT